MKVQIVRNKLAVVTSNISRRCSNAKVRRDHGMPNDTVRMSFKPWYTTEALTRKTSARLHPPWPEYLPIATFGTHLTISDWIKRNSHDVNKAVARCASYQEVTQWQHTVNAVWNTCEQKLLTKVMPRLGPSPSQHHYGTLYTYTVDQSVVTWPEA